MRTARLLLMIALMGCEDSCTVATKRDAPPSETAFDTVTTGTHTDSLLAAGPKDTVRILDSAGTAFLQWVGLDDGVTVERFRSGNLFGGVPRARLVDVNRDGVEDLFISWQYEEQASGLLLRGRRGSTADILYQAPSDLCGPPELVSVGGDGRFAIVEHQPGAVSLTDCRDGGPLAPCVEDYFIVWPRIVVIDSSTSTVATQQKARVAAVYESMVERYDESLSRLRESIRAGTNGPCDQALATRVEQQRSNAFALSGR